MYYIYIYLIYIYIVGTTMTLSLRDLRLIYLQMTNVRDKPTLLVVN